MTVRVRMPGELEDWLSLVGGVSAMPSMRGIRMSITTTSGAVDAAASTAARPEAAPAPPPGRAFPRPYLERTRPLHEAGRRGEVDMAELETCAKCGAGVADAYRHQHWHAKNDDVLSSLQRTVRDLETSTKRSLQQFEAAVRRLQ